ncbi:MAG: prolyl aminopeptidase [Neomegalonema sp.]|nr:prolyl aminopeptidase [Neomegalonema sp.]
MDLARYLHAAVPLKGAGTLPVSDGHVIDYDIAGPDNAPSVLMLHGGPGSGRNRDQRWLFDPSRYRTIAFDQRGSGQSTPFASIEHNTTAHLIDDIERLRMALGIERWIVFGGSWGATLALAYAYAHPEQVRGLVLYGVFLCRPCEIDGLFGRDGSAALFFPELYERFLDPLPKSDRADPVLGYGRLMHGSDASVRERALREWLRLEARLSSVHATDASADAVADDWRAQTAHAVIEQHYFQHHGFIDGQEILDRPGPLRKLPTQIIAGRYDMICPPSTAFDLYRAMPQSHLSIVPEAGHTWRDPGNPRALRQAVDEICRILPH